MSTTGNEYEEPGVNYPDRKDADGAEDTPKKAEPTEPSHHAIGIGVLDDDADGSGDHQGQDEGRDTLTAGAAQREAALDDAQEQRLPAMSQNNASEIDKVAGIVAQTRNDLAATEPERVPEVLRERLQQSGIDLPDAEIEELARQITTGDA